MDNQERQKLEDELAETRRALWSMKAQHKAVRQEYGSELCAGDVLKKEQLLQDEINELEAKLNIDGKAEETSQV